MSKLQILYVDDEPDIREVATFALGLDPDLEVHAVESGAEALAALQQGRVRPAALLLDVMMPGLDGAGTLAAIRQLRAYRSTPVVFITARAQAEEKARLMALGAVGVITKPFDPMTLAQDLRALLPADVG